MTLKRVLNPRIIVPAVIAAGLLGAVIALGDPAKIRVLMLRAGWPTIVAVVALTLPYLAARGVVWRQLLRQEDVRVALPPYLVAFFAGEFAKDLPGGAYVEDYLLSRCQVPVAKSVTATTALSALEVIMALPLVLLWGIPGWSWLPPSVAGILGAYVLVIAVLWYLTHPRGPAPRVSGHRLGDAIVNGTRDFLGEAANLVAWRTLRQNLPLTVVYYGIVFIDLYLVGRAVGTPGLGFHEAAVVYGFITLSLVLIPIPTNLGVTEASGAGALVAFGASPAEAVATLLVLRVLLTGSTMLYTGIGMAAFWGRARRAIVDEEPAGEEEPARERVALPGVPREESRFEV